MSEEPRTRPRNRYRGGGGCGCAGFFFVLIVGVILALFNFDISIGVSVRIPFTTSNATVAGVIGAKDKTNATLPSYIEGRLGGNQNFFNNSTTMTIGPAEGAGIVVIGRQPGAPPFDLHLVAN
jgi:hypothetical protein